MKRALPVVLLVATAAAVSGLAGAQPGRRPRPPATPPSATPAQPTAATNIRARVGTELAGRLLRSHDPDERIRGVKRAASIGTPESIAILVDALERIPQVKADSRALVEIARALARFTEHERARAGLLLVVNAGNPGLAGRLPQPTRTGDALSLEDGDPVARAELAREIAAIALARSGVDRALEALYGAARGGGSGHFAAMRALTIHPPRDPGFFGSAGASLPAGVVRMLGQLGDLRALDVLSAAARSSDVNVRSAALVSLGELGDERAIALARTAIAEGDARLRAAAGEVFVLLVAPERFKATSALIADEATTSIGVRLAERVHSPEITKLLAARAVSHPSRDLREAAIRALGRSPDPAAAKALVAPELLGDGALAYHALLALSRSPAPNAGALVAGLAGSKVKGLAVRAYVVRALMRSERAGAADGAIASLARASDPKERALGAFARVALGDDGLDRYLDDPDPRVRRAAAMASTARPKSGAGQALLARLVKESDPIARQVLALGLSGGDVEGVVKTSTLVDRAESGAGDAPLAAFALARRVDDSTSRKVGQLLASRDAVLRAHTARGLGFATLPDATGRLADAYAYETEVLVRRAVVEALAARTEDASAPSRKETLTLAAELDPDALVRQAARRALAGVAAPFTAPVVSEVAWLRVTLESGAPPGESYAGAIVRSDGIAVPVAFDEDGFALVPALPPGEIRLVLAPRLPKYETPGK